MLKKLLSLVLAAMLLSSCAAFAEDFGFDTGLGEDPGYTDGQGIYDGTDYTAGDDGSYDGYADDESGYSGSGYTDDMGYTDDQMGGYITPDGRALGGGTIPLSLTMYVYTDNGGTLNVRSEPWIEKGNVIGTLNYGAQVHVTAEFDVYPDWYQISYRSGTAYVMKRFLVSYKPAAKKKASVTATPRPASRVTTTPNANRQRAQQETQAQLNGEKTVKPFLVAVRATRASGWINFRVLPGVTEERVASLPDGRELQVIGETEKWYHAVDMETGLTGYISKSLTTVLTTPAPAATASPTPAPFKEQLGKLTVNGEFSLQCKLPEGYQMQVINTLGTRIIASITSENQEKPVLYLSIAYDEMYSAVERLNDLGQEDLQVLEGSFTQMNEVDITYTETAYGTKLMVAREIGADTDYVDILTVYKGYSIEFVMTPNPKAASQALTDDQVKMCVDFLSELDFVPAA